MMKTVLVVRHCKAEGQSPDAPITADGRAQATALADVLQPFGVERIVSSPFARARQSILPLGERIELPIDLDDRLAEWNGSRNCYLAVWTKGAGETCQLL